MPRYDTDGPRPRRRAKAFGVFLAGLVAIGSLTLVALTQEPKSAVSSPVPAKAAIVPQIADAKSEAEILFRGKSFSVLDRIIPLRFSGEILSIDVNEGQMVKQNDTLVTYRMDRTTMIQVHTLLYPVNVLNLKKAVYDGDLNIKRIKDVNIPVKKSQIEAMEKELADIQELFAKNLIQKEAIENKERQLDANKKDMVSLKDSLKQTEESVERTRGDLSFSEDKQRRDVELLEWQTQRSYAPDSKIPLDIAHLKAPISGQVIWLNPGLRIQAELPSGFQALRVAEVSPMVVRCKVHELDIVKLKQGDRGTVTFDAIPDKKYSCKISRIPWVSRNPALEVPADYEIECLLDNSDGTIKDGLTCNVRVSIAQ